MKMKNKFWSIGLSSLIVLNVAGMALSRYDTVTEVANKYVDKVNTSNSAFNMCECKETVKIDYIITNKQANRICWKAIESWLMKKSEKSGEIETAVIIGREE